MSLAAAAILLVLFLPFLLSLAGSATMPKMLCLVTSLLALLLSVTPYGAVLPWLVGMIIAAVAVFERLRRCRAI
jgi:hypothetical protein